MNQAPEEPSKKSSVFIKLSSQDAPSFFFKDLFEGYLGFWQNISSLEQEKISVDLELGVSALNEGGLVAFPTETVYGLGAMISQPAAVKKIYEYKNRPTNHPLIVHVPIGFSIEKYAKVTSLAQKLIYLFWPGPLTLILEKTDAVPFEVTGGQNSVGLRCPDHPIAQAILRGVNQGVAAPSANRFGRISPTQYEHVYHEFSEIDPHLTIIDGDILPPQVGIESTIIDARGQEPIILRPGMLGLNEILNRLAELVEPLEPPKPPKYDALILTDPPSQLII
jgi:tRNA threonylcarbamoyl adenosine modification protein (Sua5/YciO/YrdC/YwlC family)